MKKTISEEQRKLILFVIGIATLFIALALCGYQYYHYAVYPGYDITGLSIADSSKYNWSVDSITEKYDIYQVNGWIAKNGENIDTYKIYIILNNEDGSSYKVPVKKVDRTDVTTYLNEKNGDTMNYDASGFASYINKEYIHSDKCKIYILYQNNENNEIVDLSKTFE